MTVDLSALWQIVLALSAAVLAGAIPVLTRSLIKHLHLAAGSNAADDLDQALAHGAALALDTLRSIAAHNDKPMLPAGVLGNAAALVAKLAPAAVAELGITPSEIEGLITAKLGSALGVAADPASPPISTK